MSEKKELVTDSTTWHLTATTAELRTSLLGGQIDLRNPLSGLHHLHYEGVDLEGSILGLTACEGALGEGARVEEVFVRGDDLVVRYQETTDRPFSLQVYWTVAQHENGVVQVDSLFSLETQLLESFPEIQIRTEISCDQVWGLASSAAPVSLPAEGRHEGSGGLVLRSASENWSYAEMSHPEDSGLWQFDCLSEGKGVVQRTLGGTFLEKGVIRRLRLRGVFLPRKKDLSLAAESLTEFAREAPPLTA